MTNSASDHEVQAWLLYLSTHQADVGKIEVTHAFVAGYHAHDKQLAARDAEIAALRPLVDEAVALRATVTKLQEGIVAADREGLNGDVKQTYRILRDLIYDLDDLSTATPTTIALSEVVTAAVAERQWELALVHWRDAFASDGIPYPENGPEIARQRQMAVDRYMAGKSTPQSARSE